MLEEQHGVGVGDRGPEEAGRIGGRGGHHDLQPGHVSVERLDRLRVVEGAVDAAAARSSDHEGARERAVRPVADARRFRDDLVERGVDEVRELDLGHRSQPSERHADRDADDARLRERCVDHSLLAELLQPSDAHAEDPAAVADVFPEQDHPVVGRHLVVQRVADRRDDVLVGRRVGVGHASPSSGSANTWRIADSGVGSSASQAAASASSISPFTRLRSSSAPTSSSRPLVRTYSPKTCRGS